MKKTKSYSGRSLEPSGEFYESAEPTDFISQLEGQMKIVRMAMSMCVTQSEILSVRQSINMLEDMLNPELKKTGYYKRKKENPHTPNRINHWRFVFRLLNDEMQTLNLRMPKVRRE